MYKRRLRLKNKMGARQFDYYIFIDYSENLIGYNIIAKEKINGILPKITKHQKSEDFCGLKISKEIFKFRHYKDARNKKLYLKNVKNTFKKESLLDFFLKKKIRYIKDNMEIFIDVGEFIREHANCLILISVDDNQYLSFEKFVEFIDGKNIKVIKESQLIENTFEYKVSLVLDNWLNIKRTENEKI